MGLLQEERICSLWEQILSSLSRPFTGAKHSFNRVISPESVFFPLRTSGFGTLSFHLSYRINSIMMEPLGSRNTPPKLNLTRKRSHLQILLCALRVKTVYQRPLYIAQSPCICSLISMHCSWQHANVQVLFREDHRMKPLMKAAKFRRRQ